MDGFKFRKLTKYKYQLTEDYQIFVKIYDKAWNDFISLGHGSLIIKEHYAWDGASGPTIDDKTNYRASLVHDALVQLIAEGKLKSKHRKYADQLFKKILLEDGMSKFRAGYYYTGLRVYAKWKKLFP